MNLKSSTTLPQKFFNSLNTNSFKKNALLIGIWTALIFAAIALRSILLPFMLAALLAFVLNPMVSALSKVRYKNIHIPRAVGVFLVYCILFAIIYIFGVFFAPQIYAEIARLAKEAGENVNQLDEAHLSAIIHRLELFLQGLGLPIELGPRSALGAEHHLFSIDIVQIARTMVANFMSLVQDQSTNIAMQIQLIVASVVGFIFEIFLVLMIAAFILTDTQRIRTFVLSLVPSTKTAAFEKFLIKLDSGLSGVVRGQLLICLVNALLTLIGLLIIKVKFAFLLATIAGIFSLVPIFGSIISTIPIVLIGLTQSFSTAIFALLWVIGVHFLEANIFNPKILGKAAKIHPVIVVLALIAGKHFYGLVGALLAVPFTSILLTIFNFALSKALELDRK